MRTISIIKLVCYTKTNISFKSVLYVEISVRLAQLGDITLGTSDGVTATEEIGANYLKYNPNIDVKGKDVIIAIIDSGIDYLH